MKYRITYKRDGAVRAEFDTAAEEKAFVGDYVDGKPYGPVPDGIADQLPYHVRAAFWRGANGWHTEDGWRFDLFRKADQAHMGTVFANLA